REVVLLSAADPPSAVMQRHVVISTEQNAAIDVGSAVVAIPFVDVMRFAVRRGAVAPSPSASAIADCEGDALSWSEQSLFAADVERVSVWIEGDRHDAAVADMLFGHSRRHRDEMVFSV